MPDSNPEVWHATNEPPHLELKIYLCFNGTFEVVPLPFSAVLVYIYIRLQIETSLLKKIYDWTVFSLHDLSTIIPISLCVIMAGIN